MKRDNNKIIFSYQPTGYLRIILPALFLFIFLFTGCSEDDTLNMPLKTGEVHVYSGTYKSMGGVGKAIILAAGEHRLIVEREFEFEGNKRHLLTFNRDNDRIFWVILTQQDDGIYAIFGRNSKNLLFPKNVKSGQSWKTKSGSRNIVTRIGGRKTFDTGLGKLEGREVSFTTNEGNNIKIWLNDTYGVIAIHYSYVLQGANRTEADLVLKKMELLEKTSEKPSEKAAEK